jgi:hypothetical protein
MTLPQVPPTLIPVTMYLEVEKDTSAPYVRLRVRRNGLTKTIFTFEADGTISRPTFANDVGFPTDSEGRVIVE